MKHEKMKWQTNDGLSLFAQQWEPTKAVTGVICLVHGIGEHSNRYVEWVEMLTEAGYAVSTFDLRGHGQSEGQRGHSPSFNHLSDDVHLLVTNTQKTYPDKPCFVYGHSFGGLLTLYYLIQYQPSLNGAVITSPALLSAVAEQKVKVFLAHLLGKAIPTATLPSGLEQESISRDPEVVEKYRNDPLVHDRLTFGMGKYILEAIEYVNKNSDKLNLPLLMMHGSADRLAYPSGSEKLSGMITDKCTLKIWDGCYHELHNDLGKEKVFIFLQKWLDRNL